MAEKMGKEEDLTTNWRTAAGPLMALMGTDGDNSLVCFGLYRESLQRAKTLGDSSTD